MKKTKRSRKKKKKFNISKKTYSYIGIAFLVMLIGILIYMIYSDASTYYYDEPDTPFCGVNQVCYQEGLSCAKPSFDDFAAGKCISLEKQLKKSETCWSVWTGIEWSGPICP